VLGPKLLAALLQKRLDGFARRSSLLLIGFNGYFRAINSKLRAPDCDRESFPSQLSRTRA
jgi:hypothetical protein